jgi:hypothetical protein
MGEGLRGPGEMGERLELRVRPSPFLLRKGEIN